MSTAPTSAGTGEQQGAPPSPEAIMQLGGGFWALEDAAERDRAGALHRAGEPARSTPRRCATRLGLHERSARDFFDALVALGMLEREDGRYANTPATELFLDRTKPSYVGGMLEMVNARLYGFWGTLTEGLRTGQPQNEAKDGGRPLRRALRRPRAAAQFPTAMSAVSLGTGMAIAATFPWRGSQHLHRHRLRGGDRAGPDRARPRAHHRRRLRPAADSSRSSTTYVAGPGLPDRLASRRRLLHRRRCPRPTCSSWATSSTTGASTRSAMLLAKAYEALPDGGALIVYEAIIDDERRENAFGLLMSLNMLIETRGGLRLHRRRLPRLDAATPASARARRAPRRARLDGRRDQVTSG